MSYKLIMLHVQGKHKLLRTSQNLKSSASTRSIMDCEAFLHGSFGRKRNTSIFQHLLLGIKLVTVRSCTSWVFQFEGIIINIYICLESRKFKLIEIAVSLSSVLPIESFLQVARTGTCLPLWRCNRIS